MRSSFLFLALLGLAARATPPEIPTLVRAERVGDAPVVSGAMLPGPDGANINGPSLIRVPDWVPNPLGRYYLYFAHHNGTYIRLAYADRIEGPWRIREGGVLDLAAQRALRGHIASPEAVIDHDARRIHLFSHGTPAEGDGPQVTTAAVSADGLAFSDTGTVVGPAYLRVFRHRGTWYALNHSGVLRRAARLGEPFEPVATVIGPEIVAAVDPARRGEPGAPPLEDRPTRGEDRYGLRHIGLDLQGDRLHVYFSCVGHRPERIQHTLIELTGPPESWRARGVSEVLQPERPWEGTDQPLAWSRGGSVLKYGLTRVRELRDPAVLREGERAWLAYAVAGEAGIGLAELDYTRLP